MDLAASSPKRVILFRTPTSDDAYISTFLRGGYDPSCIPVLIESYETEELAEELRRGGDGWEGVVLSSKRGAEGWVRAAKGMDTVCGVGWSSVPLYAVGKSTRDVLSSSGLPAQLLPHLAEDRVAKSAVDLIPLILSHPPTSPVAQSEPCKGWLIIRGDKSLDLISGALRQAGRPFKEIIVYHTSEHPLLRQTLEDLEEGGWIAFFAPSSAGMVLDRLYKTRDRSTGSFAADDEGKIEGYRIAAIGQTTRQFLEDQGLRVDAMAESPDAEGLLRAIQEADSRRTDV